MIPRFLICSSLPFTNPVIAHFNSRREVLAYAPGQVSYVRSVPNREDSSPRLVLAGFLWEASANPTANASSR